MKFTKLLVLVLMSLFLVASVSAASVSVADVTLSVNDAVERSNPIPEGDDNELDDQDELAYVQFTIPVTITDGTANITGVTPDTSGFSYDSFDNNEVTNSDIFTVLTALPLEVTNATSSVRIAVLVPSNLDAIDTSFNDVLHTLPVSVTTTAGTDSATLGFYVDNNLEFNNIEVIIDGDAFDCDEDDNNDCDEEVEEVSPGATISVRLEVENTFDEDEEVEFDDAEVEIDSDNSDVDPDDSSEEVSVEAEEEESITFDFDVDDDVEDGDDATIELQLLGRDDNGALHGVEYEFDIEFELEEGVVDFTDFLVTPGRVCPGDVVNAEFTVENQGSDDQDNIRITVVNQPLGLNFVRTGVDIEDAEQSRSDREYQESFAFRLGSDVSAGTYPIRATVFFEDKDNDDTSTFLNQDLVVDSCGQSPAPQQPDEPEEDDTTIVVQQPDTTPDTGVVASPAPGAVIAQPVSATNQNDALVVSVLIVLIVVLGLVIGYLIYVLARR